MMRVEKTVYPNTSLKFNDWTKYIRKTVNHDKIIIKKGEYSRNQ